MTQKRDSLYRRKHTVVDTPSDDLGEYIANAERMAGQVLTDAGINPDALFKPVTDSRGSHLPFAKIDREAVEPETGWALDIVWHVRECQKWLEQNNARNAARDAIRLAQAVERFNVDRAFQKPVVAGAANIRGGRKAARIVHGKPGSKAKKYRAAYLQRRQDHPTESCTDSRKAVAADFKLTKPNSYKTIERATKGL